MCESACACVRVCVCVCVRRYKKVSPLELCLEYGNPSEAYHTFETSSRTTCFTRSYFKTFSHTTTCMYSTPYVLLGLTFRPIIHYKLYTANLIGLNFSHYLRVKTTSQYLLGLNLRILHAPQDLFGPTFIPLHKIYLVLL